MMIRAPVLSNKLPYLLYNQGTRAKTAGKHPEQKSKQILTKLLLVRPRPASRLKVLAIAVCATRKCEHLPPR